MKTREVLDELEEIRLKLYRLRLKNRHAPWFLHMIKAAEVLIEGTKSSVEHISKL